MAQKIIVFILLISTLIYSENYKKVKIKIDNESDIKELITLQLPLDDAYQNKDKSLEIFLSDNEFMHLKSSSLKYEVIIDDWGKYYKEERANNTNLQKYSSRYSVQEFTYGSMGGFYTLEEVWMKIDEMIAAYPNLISTKDSIGASYEGRPIYAVRISDNPNIDEDEPEVLYTALHHAREPEGMMQMIYYMFYLLENYGIDEEVTYLVNNREMYFIPVVNPDGYYYNQTTDPNGGGMWRKNRRYNNDGSYGVDLNRNYGYKWAYDNSGSSGIPSSSTYRGEAAFSEPETETVRQYCIKHNFRLTLNYHTYSNLLITPWGYIPEATPDSLFYNSIASDMTQYNNYDWGYSALIIYAVNGDSDDWFYGEQTEKNKIYAMTPEVGSSVDGFWPSQDRIIPLAEENIYPNLYLAWVAGGYVNPQEIIFNQEFYSANEYGKVSIISKNKGLEDISNVSIVSSSSSNLDIINRNVIDIGNVKSQEVDTLENAIRFKIKDDAIAGDSAFVELKYYSNGALMATKKVSIIIGRPSTILIDSLSTLDNWESKSDNRKSWVLTEKDFYSAPTSVTDSWEGDYLSNTTVTLTNKNKLDLTSIDKPFLRFKTKYNIESGWDYGQVLISVDSVNWKAIGGDNAKLGSGSFQPSDELIYDGTQNSWISEIVNISEYGGKEIYLKFQLKSDEYVVEDGWYIDDVEIFQYENIIVSVKSDFELLPTEFKLSQNYPNPFNPSTTIKYSIPVVESKHSTSTTNVVLKVYDILGREVATLVNEEQMPGNYSIKFDADNLTSGLYFYRISADNFIDVKKMLLLK